MGDDRVVFWFDGWPSVARVIVIGVLSYLSLLVLLRGAGKRTLSRMTTFDFVVAVAIGSVLGRVVTAEDVSLADALAAFAVLIGLEYLLSLLVMYFPRLSHLTGPGPRLLYHRGRFLRGALRRERLTEGNVLAAVREHGLGSMQDVEAVVLEEGGTFSVLRTADMGDGTALRKLDREG